MSEIVLNMSENFWNDPKVDIRKFKRFRLKKNSKNPTNDWAKANQSKSIKTGKFEGNTGVPCGKRNNIIVLDLDFMRDKNNPDGYDGLHEFDTKFKDYIQECDTFTVRTAGGGYHLYFKYDADFKNCVNKKYNIDIFTCDKYVVSPGSIVDGNEYKVCHDATIKKMPTAMKEWCLSNLYAIKERKSTRKTREAKTHKYQKLKHKFNLTKGELQRVVNQLPDTYWSMENDGFLKFTTFSKFFEIQDIWDAENQKHPNYDYENNMTTFWDTCRIGSKTEAIICQMLSKEYINYGKYKPLPSNKMQPHVRVESKKLGYDFFDQKDDYIVRSDTGTGKTTSFKHYVKQYNLPFISIVSRISLCDEQYDTFSEHGLECKAYNIADRFFDGDNIVITVDSIRRLFNIDFSKYVIFLDEFNSMLEYVITASTLAKHRSVIYRKLIKIIQTCNQVICTDADINDISLLWMNKYRPQYRFIENTYKHNQGIKAVELKDSQELLTKLREEKKFMVCTDSKTVAEFLFRELNDKSICLIVGGDRKSKTPKLDEHDKVIFSPKIMYGIDSVMKRNVYCYYKEHTIQPTGYIQQIARCRNIDTLFYLFGKKEFKYSDKTLEDIRDETYLRNELGIRYFEDETDQDMYRFYEKILIKYLYNYNCYGTNKFAHFRNLLRERGFDLDNITKFLKGKDPKMVKQMKEMKQEKLDQFDVKHYPEIHNIMQVPREQLETYKEYYIDDFARQRHFNICSMLHMEEKSLTTRMKQNQDFNVNKITQDKTKILFVKKLKGYMNTNTDFKTMSINKDITDADRETLFQEYNIVFRNQSKKQKKTFKENKMILEYLSKMYKNLFGKDIVKTATHRQMINGNRQRTYTYLVNDSVYEHHETLYRYRNPIDKKKRLF